MPGISNKDVSAIVWGRRWLDVLTLALATIFVTVCGVIAANGVPEIEESVFHAINGLPDWVYRPMWAVQFLGVLLLPALVAVVAFATKRWRLGIALLLLIPLKLFFEKVIVKELVYRARPGTSDCGGDPTCLELRDVPMVGPSFPPATSSSPSESPGSSFLTLAPRADGSSA